VKSSFVLFSFIITMIAAFGCSHDQEKSDHQHAAVEKAAESGHAHAGGATNAERPQQLELPPKLQNTLRQEMQQIESGMQMLLAHLARGRAHEAAAIAEKIHGSFILEQALSPEELQQLVALLPAEFLKMDEAFHGHAQKLAAAAEQKDFAAAIKIYSEMAQACVSCHTAYARARFPEGRL
jgi:mono/diheme cytochrome c family protein